MKQIEHYVNQKKSANDICNELNIKSKTLITASLDRIDSSKGYVIGNVQWVHKTINTMKMDLANSEFIKLCQMVAKNHDNNVS